MHYTFSDQDLSARKVTDKYKKESYCSFAMHSIKDLPPQSLKSQAFILELLFGKKLSNIELWFFRRAYTERVWSPVAMVIFF